jgi:hypothetical protein
MEVPANFTGGCACGSIRYQCSAAPVAMINCHCRDCQRAGGSAYSPTVVIHRANFLLLQGEPRYHEITADSGNTARRGFCEKCGSPLFASSSARPDVMAIRAGSLDDPKWFRAAREYWTHSAQPWDILSPETVKFARGGT